MISILFISVKNKSMKMRQKFVTPTLKKRVYM